MLFLEPRCLQALSSTFSGSQKRNRGPKASQRAAYMCDDAQQSSVVSTVHTLHQRSQCPCKLYNTYNGDNGEAMARDPKDNTETPGCASPARSTAAGAPRETLNSFGYFRVSDWVSRQPRKSRSAIGPSPLRTSKPSLPITQQSRRHAHPKILLICCC